MTLAPSRSLRCKDVPVLQLDTEDAEATLHLSHRLLHRGAPGVHWKPLSYPYPVTRGVNRNY